MNAIASHPFLNEPRRAQQTLERRLQEDRVAARQRQRRLGDTLMGMGLMSERDVKKITRLQEDTHQPFGKLAIKHGMVKAEDIQAAIGVQFGFLREADGPISIPEHLTVMRRPHSDQSEKIRLMRTRLVTSCDQTDLRTMSVIGFGEDKASVEMAANLGATFAQLQRRVLLIDANLRAPSLPAFFGLPPEPGLVDYLSKRARFEDVIQQTLVNRLDILPAGQRAYNPQILLGSDTFDALLKRARRDYDMIMLLSSGYGPIADGQFVWQKSESAIIVARKNKTCEDDLTKLSAVLYDLRTKVLGAVLAR